MQETGTPLAVQSDRLAAFTAALFATGGVPEADARLVADSLVQADLWGHQSHGVLRAPWYLARLRSGAMTPTTEPRFVVDAGAVAVVDAGEGIGQVISAFAMDEAVRRCRSHGVGVVSVRRSNHFGTAMYYTLRAARAGCVGFLSTNGSPAMPPWGGRRKTVGTNPWSIAAPAGRHAPMVLDIANTAVARGKIYLARNKGVPIPEGWALDSDGHPTTDPQEGIDGVILPMAGHKGYGISLMMDVLSGVLSGSRFLTGVNGPYHADRVSGCGHLVIALDIAAFRPPAEFVADIESMIAEVKAAPPMAGVDEIFYPGEIEARNDTLHRREGLRLAPDTLRDLEQEAEAAGMTDGLPW
jgi:LDH2 family malate/lactate/ureidoglycolate dehydrogenase